ncbi:hypothetical protein ACS0TY_012767 [Phlomoides rotata]
MVSLPSFWLLSVDYKYLNMEFSFNYVHYLVDPRLTVLRRPIKNLRQLKRNPISTTSSSDWLVTYTGDTVERPYIEDSSHLEGIIRINWKTFHCFSKQDVAMKRLIYVIGLSAIAQHVLSLKFGIQLFEVVSALRIATRILLHRSVIAAILLSIQGNNGRPDFENDVFFREVEVCFVREHPNGILGSGLRSQGLTGNVSICYNPEPPQCSYFFYLYFSRATMADPDFEHDVFFREVEVYFLREHLNAIMGSGLRIQGRTDTCYALTCVNCIYADLHIHKGESLRASEQLLLDCLHIDYPLNGGLHEREPGAGYPNSFKNAFLYATSKGLLLDKNYPWVGRFKECERCKKKEADLIFSGMYEHLWSADDVLEALCRPGAVAASVYATRRFKWRKGTNIYTMTNKERRNRGNEKKKVLPRHAITLIGYGVEEGIQYYLAQNSWGMQVGYNGFIKIERGCVRTL